MCSLAALTVPIELHIRIGHAECVCSGCSGCWDVRASLSMKLYPMVML